jgi:hypothetical protein
MASREGNKPRPKIKIVLSGEYSNSPASEGRTNLTIKGFADKTEFWLTWVSVDDRMGPELVATLPGPFDWRAAVNYLTTERELVGLPAPDATIAGIGGIPAEILRMAWCEAEDAPAVAKALASCTDEQLVALLPKPSARAINQVVLMVEGILKDLQESELGVVPFGELLQRASRNGRTSIKHLVAAILEWQENEEEKRRSAAETRRQTLLPFADMISGIVGAWQARNRAHTYASGMAMLMNRSRLLKALEEYVLEHGKLPSGMLTVEGDTGMRVHRILFNLDELMPVERE